MANNQLFFFLFPRGKPTPSEDPPSLLLSVSQSVGWLHNNSTRFTRIARAFRKPGDPIRHPTFDIRHPTFILSRPPSGVQERKNVHEGETVDRIGGFMYIYIQAVHGREWKLAFV